MANTLKGIVQTLRDPFLVRKLQETFGVRVIDETKGDDSDNNELSQINGPIKRSSESIVNGAIKRLASIPSKKQVKRRQPGVKMESPPSSPDSMTPPPELPDIIVETYNWVDVYFKLASELGYEPFYITFLPFLFWNVDTLIFRHLIVLWCLSMYIGQALKPLIKWPRPSAPPAIRLEVNPALEMEYGFPSTHAIVSTTIPFYIAYSTYWRYEGVFIPVLCITCLWWVSVCCSRIYLGVHTIIDVIAGIFISVILLSILIPHLETMDELIFRWPHLPPVAIATVVLALYVYPVEDRWTMDRGDTGAILGVGLGVILASHFCGPFPDDLDTGPFVIKLPSLQTIGLCFIRWIVGILLLLPTRFIMKLLCFRLLPAIVPTHGVEEVAKRPLVELPYKVITYSSIGFNAIYLSTMVFEICAISRWQL